MAVRMDPRKESRAMYEVTMRSSPEEKIRLFRALFQGRLDVYARRWENTKTGKCGYAPACEVEWVRGVCEKPKVSCSTCEHRRFLPVTDQVVEMHLRGQDLRGKPFVVGCYPLLTDDTVKFAAIDFDKLSWRADTASVIDVLRELELPVARERSRSGRGAHLWFFFEQPVSARTVRDVLSFALSLTMERNPTMGLDSYDRIFPNQNRLPKGGFGNLFALPLQGLYWGCRRRSSERTGTIPLSTCSAAPYDIVSRPRTCRRLKCSSIAWKSR